MRRIVPLVSFIAILFCAHCGSGPGGGGSVPYSLSYAGASIPVPGVPAGAIQKIPVMLENRYSFAGLTNPTHTFPVVPAADIPALINDPVYRKSLGDFNSLPGPWYIKNAVKADYGFFFESNGVISGEPESFVVKVSATRKRAGKPLDIIVRYVNFFGTELIPCSAEQVGEGMFRSIGSCGSPGRVSAVGGSGAASGFIYKCSWNLSADFDPVADPDAVVDIGAELLIKEPGVMCSGGTFAGKMQHSIAIDHG